MGNFYLEHLRSAEREWLRNDRDPALLLTGLDAALAGLWLHRHRQAADPAVTQTLAAFLTAGNDLADLDTVWRIRTDCDRCHETYKMENMANCVECGATLCWRCHSQTAAPCPRCEGEMY